MELPWDQVDIKDRNDEYYSIGTAFSISESTLITASHVMDLYNDSEIFKKRFIRETLVDGKGIVQKNIYEVDKILAVNNHKDYVLFNVKDKTFDSWFETSDDFSINEKVYTVGNALGQGIVVRDGFLLDRTLESENGEWSYLKSSSLTNPGNSGGPLLNASGEVIGIVLAKEDDFCYSLPISEIKYGEALYHSNIRFGFDLFDFSIRDFMDYNFDDDPSVSLPIDYQEYSAFHAQKYLQFANSMMDRLFEQYEDDIFPNGNTSEIALQRVNQKTFPQVLLRDGDDGIWFYSNLSPRKELIRNNGQIRYQQIYKDANFWMFEFIQSDDLEPFALFENPKFLMDYFLQGIKMTRTLYNGDPGTRIISYGEPRSSFDYSDSYSRKWKINTWLQEYNDTSLVLASTPTPKGLASIYFACDSSDTDAMMWDLKKLLDFIDINYYGKISEWKDFLAKGELIPDLLKDIEISYVEGESFQFDSDDLSIKLDNTLFDIDSDDRFDLSLDTFKSEGEIRYGIRKMVFSEKENDNFFLSFNYLKPDETLPEGYFDSWNSITKEQHPYTGIPYYDDDGDSKISALHPHYLKNGRFDGSDGAYSVTLLMDGKVDDEKMIELFNHLKDNFVIR